MRTFLFALSLSLLASACAVETRTHMQVDGTDVTITTLHDEEADEEATFGLRLGEADPGTFSFVLLAD